MISASLPAIDQFSFQRPPLSHNAVILANTTHSYYYPEHKTPYLLMTNGTGRGNYVLNKQLV